MLKLIAVAFLSFLSFGLFFSGIFILSIRLTPLGITFYAVLLASCLTSIICLWTRRSLNSVQIASAIAFGLVAHLVIFDIGVDAIMQTLATRFPNRIDLMLDRVAMTSLSIVNAATLSALPVFAASCIVSLFSGSLLKNIKV